MTKQIISQVNTFLEICVEHLKIKFGLCPQCKKNFWIMTTRYNNSRKYCCKECQIKYYRNGR